MIENVIIKQITYWGRYCSKFNENMKSYLQSSYYQSKTSVYLSVENYIICLFFNDYVNM